MQHLSKQHLLDLLEVNELCLQARSEEQDLQIVIEKLATMLPYEGAVIALIDNYPNVVPRSLMYNYRCEEWLQYYYHNNLQEKDPVFNYFIPSGEQILSRSEIYQRATDPDSQDYISTLREFGFQNGLVSVASQVPASANIAFSWAINESTIEPYFKEIIRAVTPHINEVFNRQGSLSRKNRFFIKSALTAVEVEILQRYQQGKDLYSISLQLKRSEHDVLRYLQIIFAKLCVNSLSGAVARGLSEGIIEL